MQSAVLTVTVNAPASSGSYVLECQMVQEQIAWFPQYLDSQAAVGTGTAGFPPGTTSFTTPDGEVISERVPNGSGGYNTYYYLHDGLGSVVAVIDGSGTLYNTYSYDPYGNATSVSEQVPNPFRYVGGVWEGSTGLYKLGARYYDPSIGRFTQVDPAGCAATTSLYSYADGDPATLSDPMGLVPGPACGACHALVDAVNFVARHVKVFCGAAVHALCAFYATHGGGHYHECVQFAMQECNKLPTSGHDAMDRKGFCRRWCNNIEPPQLPPTGGHR